jgi:hypothetical protein
LSLDVVVCTYIYRDSRIYELEDSCRNLAKQREQINRKGLLNQDVEARITQAFAARSNDYDILKKFALSNLGILRKVAEDTTSKVTDDVRKTYLHMVNLLKNLDYDINCELKVDSVNEKAFDAEKNDVSDVLTTLDELPFRDIAFTPDAYAAEFAQAIPQKPAVVNGRQSLTESVISLFGLSLNQSEEDKQTESVI